MHKILLLIFLFAGMSQAFGYSKTPNPDYSPGHACTIKDKDFDRYRYKEKIPYCRRNVSKKTKDSVCLRDGVKDRSNYTVDHIIPLSIGGSNSNRNLWCQNKKIHSGSVEYQLYRKMEEGTILQKDAIDFILNYKFKL